MKTIPLHRVAVVRPFTEFLRCIGAPVEGEFRRTGLSFFALDEMDNYLPSKLFWNFLVRMSKSQGVEDLGFRVGQASGANSADPNMTGYLNRSPTLKVGLLRAAELANRTITHCEVGLIGPTCSGDIHLFHRPSCTTQNPALADIGWYGINVLSSFVRVFAGPAWCPHEIGVMTPYGPSRYIREQLPGARILHSQPYSYVALPSELLCRPPHSSEATAPAQTPVRYTPAPSGLVDSLEAALVTCLQEDNLNIRFAAEICNLSVRTLQRTLEKNATSYREVLSTARYRASTRMLRDTDMKVADVAARLGYTEPAHFSRAFRRIAGVSPRTYQRQTSPAE